MANRILANEDGNLGQSTIISARDVLYSDIDLTLDTNTRQDVFKKRDASAVKQAVKTCVMTNFYEKPFQPLFGANLRSMLFELNDPNTGYDIRRNIIEAIQSYEPRARVESVDVNIRQDFNDVNVTVNFSINNVSETVSFTTNLTRLR